MADKDEALKILGFGTTNNPQLLEFPGTDPNLPGTPPEIAAQEKRLGPTPSFAERNSAGVPIDTSTGAPATVKFNVSLMQDPNDKIRYLNEFYGNEFSRIADDGSLIARVIDEKTGTAKDITINEEGFKVSDLASLGPAALQMAAAGLAAFAGKGLPLVGKAKGLMGATRDIVTTSIGAETAGALEDVAGKRLAGSEVNVEEIAKERAGNLPTDIAIGAAIGVGIKTISKIVTPFGTHPGPLQVDAKQAVKDLKERFGVDIPMTAGEKTGSQLLLRTESMMKRLPGGSQPFGDLRTAKTDAINRLQNRMLGLPEEAGTVERQIGIPTTESVGAEATKVISDKIAPMVAGAQAAKEGVVKIGSREILNSLDELTVPGRRLYPEKVGAAIRAKAQEMRGQFVQKTSDLYDKAYSLEGGTERILSTPSLAGRAKKLLKELPQKESTTETPTGLLDEFGGEITKTVTGEEVSKEFVPPNIVGKLNELITTKGQKRSLKDLVALRTEVDNDIAQGEAIKGVQTHYLGKIRQMLTDSIDEATSTLPDSRLKDAWQLANDTYKQDVGKFHQGPIAKLFKDIEQRGFVQDEDIVRAVSKGGASDYRVMKEFLGENSREFLELKRAVADDVLNNALLPGVESEALVDGAALVKELSGFFKRNRAAAEDIFGPKAKQILSWAEEVGAAQGKIPLEELKDLGTRPGATAINLRRAVAQQEAIDKVSKSSLLKDIAEKKLDPESFSSADFINRVYNISSKDELKTVLDYFADRPDILEKIRVKTAEKIFFDAQRSMSAEDVSSLGRGTIFKTPSTRALEKAFGNEENKTKLEFLLGKDTFKDFEDLAKMLRVGEGAEATFKAAAGLSAGAQTANLLKGGVFSYLTGWAEQKVAALLLTTPIVRSIIVPNTLMNAERTAQATYALLASRPLIEAAVENFGPETAKALISDMKASVDKFVLQGPSTEPSKTKRQKVEELIRPPEIGGRPVTNQP